jgi:oxygen-dependent protoporphyrinogen oxidase
MRVVVIGAGIAGLTAAYELGLRGAEVTVLEGADRIGGKLRVSPVGGVPVDEGAEMFLLRVPDAVALVAELGLAGEVVHPVTTAAGVYVDGAAVPLPAGTLMGIPANPASVRDVLGAAGVAAATAEPGLPGEPLRADVAVGEYVTRRLGRAFVDRLVDPLLGGVYAGRADELSLEATVPALYAALRRTPSLVAAAAAATGQPGPSLAGGPAADTQARPLGSPPGNPVFGTLPGGLGTLPGVVLAASGAALLLRLPARELHRTATGFRVVAGPVPDPTYLEADAVVVAVPASKAAPLLREVAPAAATDLAAIEYASMAVITLAYRDADLPPGSGLLVPATAGRAVKALTYASAKWAHLRGQPVVRASVGRYGETATLRREDPDLVDLVRADLADLTGVRQAPVATRVTRWGGGLPQYAVGHTDRVRRIRTAVAQVPGLAVCGAAYEGVGVPACVRTARAAAAQVLSGTDVAAQSKP